MREESSKRKMAIAKSAARVLSSIPSIKFVGVTGALAMKNASEESDIDLMIVSSGGTLWVTRIAVYLILKLKGFDLRKSGDINEKDKLCLNIWLDEDDLLWSRKERNIFVAHEISQVIPLVSKNGMYEKFVNKNKWTRKFWPNATRKVSTSNSTKYNKRKLTIGVMRILEPFARATQYLYMKNKITREVVTPTRALFHPVEWSGIIESRMESIIENLSTSS
jgi:predicted nucleotidyltransferase